MTTQDHTCSIQAPADCHLHWLANKKEWNGTSVEWKLSPGEGTTMVQMTHRGLTAEGECYGACENGWNGHIQNSLLPFLMEGRGFPR